MSADTQSRPPKPRSHRPRATTVFLAAFIAGAAAAIGVNRVLDVQLAQRRPRIESEPIFVALRSLPPGSPVTVWDVALRDWPKAMLPAAAMRPHDSFEGMLLKHPLREGQPVLTVQLVKDTSVGAGRLVEGVAPGVTSPASPAVPQPDLWAPAELPTAGEKPAATAQSNKPAAAPTIAAATPSATEPARAEPVLAEPALAEPSLAEPFINPEPAMESVVVESIVAPVELAATPITTDIEPAPAGRTSEQIMRYLVVPERIAVQADRYFVPEGATTPVAQSTVPEVAPQQAASQQAQTAVEQPVTYRGSTPPGVRQPQQPAQRPAMQSTGRKPQLQRSPRSAMQNPPNPTMFQSMFPNLAAGMSAAGEQLDTDNRNRDQGARSASTPQPTQAQGR